MEIERRVKTTVPIKKKLQVLTIKIDDSNNQELHKIVKLMTIEEFEIIWDYLEYCCPKTHRDDPFTWCKCLSYATNLPMNAEKFDLGFDNLDAARFCELLADSLKNLTIKVDEVIADEKQKFTDIQRRRCIAEVRRVGKVNFFQAEKVKDTIMEIIEGVCKVHGIIPFS